MKKLALLLGVVAVGCTAQPPAPTAAARQLGIERYESKRTPTSLVIEGVDAAGQVVGRATLTVGRFTMQDDGDTVDGRQLDVDVAGAYAHHESRGFNQLRLPLNGRPAEIRTFLLDPLVISQLVTWGVDFDASGQAAFEPQPLETPYELNCTPYALATVGSNPYGDTGGCTYNNNCPGNYSCEQFDRGGGESGEYVCCVGNATAVERTCTSPYSSSSCGGTGDKGCAPCWSMPQHGCRVYGGSYSEMHFCTE